MKAFARILAAVLALIACALLVYLGNIAFGMGTHARYDGTVSGLRVRAAVEVLRDDRGIPHIIARDDRDLFFAQGYVEASDRLFQMDLLRRFTLGKLAEVFGAASLATDEEQRAIPVGSMVARQWQRLDDRSRDALAAFSEGVNAAMQREPLPVEFRILGYRPSLWTPQDSLAVGMATVLDLTDDWNAVAPRDAAYRRGGLHRLERLFPLTDPCYDAPVMAGLRGIGPGPRCNRRSVTFAALADSRVPTGSNEWVAGADRSRTNRALLANDPHLGLGIPGVWYLIDLQSPGYHVAGASLPGLPAVVLGHNEHLAWGVTAGTVASLSVFRPPGHLNPRGWESERFAVRFRPDVVERYYRTPREFGVVTSDKRFVLVRWNAYDAPFSAAQNFIALDRAASIEAATRALSTFPGPTLNFVLADTTGRAAYVLAGQIPNDPVRARWFHRPADLANRYAMIPFARLPKVAPSRSAVLWTANNKMYGDGYPLQLSPQFAPPYRAYRIAQLLRARPQYDLPYFEQMQMDALSLPERELAHALAPAVRKLDANLGDQFATWNGEMTGDSQTAAVVVALRLRLTQKHNGRMPAVVANAPRIHDLSRAALSSPAPWAIAGAVRVSHPLAKIGMSFLNGTLLPGYGDAFTLHVQTSGYSQSFRAVWEVGDWNAGGITLPQGESGEPASGHYTDQAQAWVSGRLRSLPFGGAAVHHAAIAREILAP
ncbi:MAG: penicillin acylase family protein [Candidatus Eremiobacteraeota bacterium]|nr:penicillin acylase family protein [Candidatus Eremiobacteraeota bacterium]